jgi:hypothetical protein
MASTNLIVFRENSVDVCGRELGRNLVQAMERAKSGRDQDSALNALLMAGAVECALADRAVPERGLAQTLTDQMAQLLVHGTEQDELSLTLLAGRVGDGMPMSVMISPPEGFAYYALHPLDFAEAVSDLARQHSVAVVGIRTIGAVLSAVTMAALHKQGIKVSRTSVRPDGHPYHRRTRFSPDQLAWIQEHKQRSSVFLVVDEGPGLSGSSFLSVAEALRACGVACNRLKLIGTRDVDPDQLCASGAASRWQQFNYCRVQSLISRKFGSLTALGSGAWREHLLNRGSEWPGSWTQMERLKFLDYDRRHIFKFDGLGYFGEQVRERARAIHETGFGPQAENAGDGMTAFAFISGTPLSRSDCSTKVLDRIAEYCAFRLSEFRVDDAGDEPLELMAHHNFEQEFGRELALPRGFLEGSSSVIVDGRMQPHEWICSADGKILKVDACTHGDDHFQPGPTDIAWDLAGVIVEWDLDQDSESYFLRKYHERTSDDPSRRLPHFVLAYTIYRMAYTKMALNATQDKAERVRLERTYRFYRNRVDASCGVSGLLAARLLSSGFG